MTQVMLSIPDQIKKAMDGRTKRWLALEIRMPEPELSKRMNGHTKFSEEELERIEKRLSFKIER